MMFEEHPSFEAPENKNQKIWRYLDFTKLVQLLETESLYFCRADKFEDPFEGAVTYLTHEARNYIQDKGGAIQRSQQALEWNKQIAEVNRKSRRFYGVNCWHMNNCESAAMWSLYVTLNEGVAIQSTYKRLVDSLSETNESVYIGKVRYIDYKTDFINSGNMFAPFLHKRRSFLHENELRAIIHKFPDYPPMTIVDWTLDSSEDAEVELPDPMPVHIPGTPLKTSELIPVPPGKSMDHGLDVSVCLDTLIERIYVSPNSPSWFGNLVDSILKKYGMKAEIHQSNLTDSPLF